jgi:hypothetical protein
MFSGIKRRYGAHFDILMAIDEAKQHLEDHFLDKYAPSAASSQPIAPAPPRSAPLDFLGTFAPPVALGGRRRELDE